MALFTRENARAYSEKGNAERRKRMAERQALPAKLAQSNEGPAHERLSRLWECLESIDRRIQREVRRERPNMKLAKELGALAKVLSDQAGSTNGHKASKAAASGPAAPPDPEAAG